MREILFRGKRVDNGKEVIGFYFNVPEHHNPDLSGKSIIISINNGLYFEVVPETVGQYTGLTDKNGMKVFEGDILIDDNNWVKGLVVFRHTSISPDFDDSCEGSGFYAVVQRIPYRGLTYICSSKIIGNIHDNPDLWEGEGPTSREEILGGSDE